MTKVFLLLFVLSAILKQQFFDFAVENDARKTVETFCTLRLILLALIFLLKMISSLIFNQPNLNSFKIAGYVLNTLYAISS